ncbi:MAG: recombination mediator RecR [Minisyncoccia bacterium]
MLPSQIQKFINEFSKLPSIGPRMATRLAFYLANLDVNSINELEKAINGIKQIDHCPQCFFWKERRQKLCSICSDQKRNQKIITIVEKETDVLAIENTKQFNGNYLILGELTKNGTITSTQKLRLESLKSRINKNFQGKIDELILAMNPNLFGDITANLIKSEFKGLAKKITRLSRGIPTGGEIEFADEETLKEALNHRS